MWFLTLICYFSILVQVIFITISIAAGLYYLAELVEEYSSYAKKIIWWMNIIITLLYVLLWLFESFPSTLIACGILAQVCHFVILSNFPYVAFTSPFFIFAVIFVVINHYLAFSYFTSTYHPFSEVIAYFTLYLWLVPFALFVSLSANDNILPTTADHSDVVSNYIISKRNKSGLLTLFTYAKETLLPVRTKKGTISANELRRKTDSESPTYDPGGPRQESMEDDGRGLSAVDGNRLEEETAYNNYQEMVNQENSLIIRYYCQWKANIGTLGM
ncbi:unnamed protein product [Ceutorhynchus assimilis]|uniref:Protein TEX261 n=1 Tax=Ceutorhynchus assimilis TaxID=467358 RepID=A0A9N9MY57_9CUCU|nr:unnamed protein product [Ceutorhynchus assimilis]